MSKTKGRISDISEMKTINMADGAVLVVPIDFIELKMGRVSNDYHCAGVLTTRRCIEYNFPIYFFFYEPGEIYMDEFRDKVFKACSKMDKRFDELRAKEIMLDFEIDGKELSPEEWRRRYSEYAMAPEFQLFEIHDDDYVKRYHKNEDYHTPYNAIIHRR